MKLQTVNQIKQYLVEQNLVRAENMVGCSQTEISEIMSRQNVLSLPRVYLDFLTHMGKSAGIFLGLREGYFYPWLLETKAEALEILKEENAPMQLPEDAFVFFAHDQGYMFYFFRTSHTSEDIDYYEYMDGRQEFTLHKSLLSFYQSELDILIR